MNNNLQQLYAQIETLVLTVDEMLASSTPADRVVLQAKYAIQRDVITTHMRELRAATQIVELTYNEGDETWQ